MAMNMKELSPDLFEPAEIDTEAGETVAKKRLSYWADVRRRFLRNRGAVIGLILIVVIGLMAVFGPGMNEFNFRQQDFTAQNISPFDKIEGTHWFGTDNLGRDLWTRTWYGAGISLLIALIAAAIDLTIGVIYGAISGYFGGKVDDWMQRIIEVLVGIPNLIVIILLLIWLEPGIFPIALAIALTGWVNMARIVRAQMLQMKSQEYVLAARTLGANTRRMLTKHMLPNVMGPVIITLMFTIPNAIFFEAFLGFIGLGLRPPEASLGVLINEGYGVLQIFPYQTFFPATVLSLLMLSFNLLGDGLRDALDPKMRK
ncbi:MAG: ABC transporter permease [Firmicutes bacterium]|uniref:Oligopeptide transport system permease protein n=1 Tax=Melghirimyces thermohalophilus TaxID=1236220 RepID=A0A1G6L5H0_9BACL|nr:ABC transporter permease [Melghirimyces thermohalophilus]MDA8353717.1 ABC transporter permease [Bacillota bacterium]SDC38464.1 oligopeptide transport system permease protein [Melghirimyces thermohalophilus]